MYLFPFSSHSRKYFQSQVVNQVGYNLFGNKPSCRQRQYEAFRSSNSRHLVALYSHGFLDVLTCSELFLDVSSWQIIVSRATADPCFWEKARIFFHLENYGYSIKCLLG